MWVLPPKKMWFHFFLQFFREYTCIKGSYMLSGSCFLCLRQSLLSGSPSKCRSEDFLYKHLNDGEGKCFGDFSIGESGVFSVGILCCPVTRWAWSILSSEWEKEYETSTPWAMCSHQDQEDVQMWKWRICDHRQSELFLTCVHNFIVNLCDSYC